MHRFLVALLVSALSTVSAEAQDYAPPKIGLKIVYRTQGPPPRLGAGTSLQTISICAVDRDTVAICIENSGAPRSEQRTFRGLVSYRTASGDVDIHLEGDLDPLRNLWPLKVGKSAEALLQLNVREASSAGAWRTRGGFRFTFSIEEEEDIVVPAGRFRTWIIRVRTSPGATDHRIWFAPALGWYVRAEQRTSGGLHVREAVRILDN